MIDVDNRIYDNDEYFGFLNTNFFNVGIYLRLAVRDLVWHRHEIDM